MTIHDPNWTQIAPVIGAAFLASTVEFVEALTVVLAVGAVRGWRHAVSGALSGVAVLGISVLVFGRLLLLVPMDALRLLVGVLLLLFGMRWLHKAVLREAGIVAPHDEAEIFTRAANELRIEAFASDAGTDPIAFATAFKAVVLEGLEVVFIVVAVGSAHAALIPASLGAALAGLVVIAAAIAVHRPLTQVPENIIKFAVGVLISAFGVFWIGEALNLHWPGGDVAILPLAAALLVVAVCSVKVARYEAGIPSRACHNRAVSS
jgi:uncharacterized membrane protein